MISKNSLAPGKVSINIVLFLFVAFLSSIVLGNMIAQGSVLEAYLGMLVVVGLVALQQLKSSFWLLIPFSMVSQLPAISIIVASLTLGELWIIASVVFVILYWFMEKRKIDLLLPRGFWMYAYAAWAMMILAMNPVGLSFTGVEAGGARFYIKIGLALIAFFIIANNEMGEKNAKRIIVLLLVGVGAETVFKLVGAFVPQVAFLTAMSAGGAGGDVGFYGWSQLLAVFPATAIPFIFARYSINELFHPSKWWVAFTVLLLLGMVLLSGKRSLAFLVFLYPGVLAVIRGRLIVAVAYGMAGVLLLALLFGAHSSGVTLPKNTQRILSIIPGVTGLDREVTQSAGNDFRETLNRFALDEIRERPVLGRGFKVDLEALYYLENNPSQVLGADDHFAGAKYAATSNWHNTWLGISADFGIPAAVIFAFLMIGYFRKSLRVLRQLDQKSFQWALVAGILAIVIGDLIRSWQFGHASLTYWNISWKVGVLFAVENWVRATNTKKIAAQREGGQEPPQQSEGMRFTRSRQGG